MAEAARSLGRNTRIPGQDELNINRLRTLDRLVAPHPAAAALGPDAARGARLTATLSLLLSFLLGIYFLRTLLTDVPTSSSKMHECLMLFVSWGACTVVYVTARTRYAALASQAMVTSNILAVALSLGTSGDVEGYRFVTGYLLMPLVMATLMLGRRGVLVTGAMAWTALELIGLFLEASSTAISDARFHFLIVGALVVFGYSIRLREVETGRSEAQRAYERLDGILRLAPIGVFETSPEGECTFASGRMAELVGAAGSEACLGDGWRARLHADDRERVVQALKERAKAPAPLAFEARFCRADGSEAALHVVLDPVRGGFLGAALDVTEARRAARELEEERARHAESSRLASLGEMAGGIAHEINNPLAIIDGKTRMARHAAENGVTDKVIVHLASIEHNAGRIARIVHGLRSAARDGARDPFTPERLGGVVDNALSLCRERILSRGVRLDERTEAAAETAIECRPTQIVQVLVNLLSNAFDAASAADGAWIAIEAQKTEAEIVLTVANSGAPIPLAVREKMFRPFFTTKEVGKGTGLGLSISRGLVQDHGGSLEYDGASPTPRFVLRLPRRQPRLGKEVA